VQGIVLAQGLVAAALYTALAGFSYSPTLTPGREPEPTPEAEPAVDREWDEAKNY
jgi:hypothetical protein